MAETERKVVISFDENGYFTMHAEGVGPLEIYTACSLLAEHSKGAVMAMMFGGDPRIMRPDQGPPPLFKR